ncbi:CaiB/BaiF CoA transferase family protein [Bosea sp. (in: a-proteobacteria)]|jgi:crotonobetainyl-CoA:carnitine CoA-transferase CaiB-like acyl-CoA transferase|uniref:CaiB/BaiF CoA transferase family protein n=1 Tax=Bosea sp. (in: a-proteobacteria) TaxID=1871050 RepID=UPI003F70734C
MAEPAQQQEGAPAGALDGIRVLDFSRIFAGPAATQILGDLGADIIKIEEPGTGDGARSFGVTEEAMARYGASPSYLALNRNKRSMVLDLRKPEARELAARMAAECDVVINNFRPGAMATFGLGYEQLKQANPGLIFCEFSAYGDSGPLSHLGANDVALQAHSGMMSITGEADGEPVRCGTAVIDLHASLALVSGILAALFHRQRTGQGQRVETSLLRSSAHLMNYFYTDYWLTGAIHKPMGTANHLSVPNQAFPAADGRVVIIAPADDMWKRCAAALDPERLDKPQFRTAFDRRRNRVELVAVLSEVTRALPSRVIVEKLGAAKVNVAKVHDVGEAADHAQLAAIGGVVAIGEGAGAIRSVSSPFALSATPARIDRPPPELDADQAAILDQFGIGQDERARLTQAGAFGAPA